MQARFELFDHTADLGLRVFAPTPAELVWPATQGLYAIIGQPVPVAGSPTRHVRFEINGDAAALLLRDYLADLLGRFETQRVIAVRVQVDEFSSRRLAGVVELAAVDEERSVLEREAKAVTYHQLELGPAAGGYAATFIVDI